MENITVSVNGLSAGYGKTPVVSDVSFDVKSGEILTVIGPNGAGKSTVLKAISGYLEKICGSVAFCGKSADKISRHELSKILSVMLTERIKPELMTCRDVVETGRYPYTGKFGLLSARDNEVVENAIKAVEAESFADEDFNSVSDGQRQRIMLARAICQEPEILILDEPASYLDIRHKVVFFEILKNLVSKTKIAVILSMHELDFAEKVSDRVLCVKNGRIVFAGEPETVFTEENIRGLYDIPVELYRKYFG